MSEDKQKAGKGFKIKWADREVEYYGDAADQNFDKVLELLKVIQPTAVPSSEADQTVNPPTVSTTNLPTSENEYQRIVNDAKVTMEKLTQIIKFEKRTGFDELVPILPAHPNSRDAVRLIIYALQVGLQKAPIEISYLKDILMKTNGYPLPGSELGRILHDFRRDNVTITSQTQGRNMPVTLSTKGLEQARALLS